MFPCLFMCAGLNTGSYYAIGTLLNTIVLHYFPVSSTIVMYYDGSRLYE